MKKALTHQGQHNEPTCSQQHWKFKILASVLFLQNFADAKFRENKPLTKWRNHCLLMQVNYVLVLNC